MMNRVRDIGSSFQDEINFKQGNMNVEGVLSLHKSITQHLAKTLQQLSLVSPDIIGKDCIENIIKGIPHTFDAATIEGNEFKKTIL